MHPSRNLTRAITWIIFGSAVAAVVMGFIGFSRLPLGKDDGIWGTHPVARFFDLLYLSLGMLSLVRQTWGDPFLQIGRWFGIVFVFSAVVRVLLPRSLEAMNQWRIRRMRGHSVVVGVGARGRAFLQDLGQREPVIGFDRLAPGDLGLGDLMAELPLRLVTGDATVRLDLERANVPGARRAIVCVGSDAANHAVAREIVALLRARGRDRALQDTPLDLIVPCRDQLFGKDLIGELDGAPFAAVRPINLHAGAARTLLLRLPWLLAGDRLLDRPRHWLLVGWDDHADALAVASQSLGAGLDGGAPMLTAFVDDPQATRALLHARYPAARPQWQRMTLARVDPLGAVAADDFDAANGNAPVGAIFVFGFDDSVAFATACRMRRLASARGNPNVPVFVRMDDPLLFSSGLEPLSAVPALSHVIEPFGALSEACSERALYDWEEMLARDVHAGYREHLAAYADAGGDSARPSGRAWAELGELLRDSNRRVIDHLPVKLAGLGLIVRGALPLPRFALPLRDVPEARITRLEHASWIAERRLAGTLRGTGAGDEEATAMGAHEAGRSPAVHYEPFRTLFDRPYRPSDPRLCDWVAERHRAGDGAWRERVLTVVARPPVGELAAARLDAALRAFLGEPVLDQHLGDGGEEFWTLVSALDTRDDAHLLRALLRVLGSTAAGVQRSRRFRIVVLRPAGTLAHGGSDRIGLDALAAFGARAPVDFLLELPTPAARRGSPAAAAAATDALLAAMAGRSDETLVFGAALLADDTATTIDVPGAADAADAVGTAGTAGAADRMRWPARLAPLYAGAAGRVIDLAGVQP